MLMTSSSLRTKERKKSAEASKLAVESTKHQHVKKYPDVEAI
jgi:hypothetical protein